MRGGSSEHKVSDQHWTTGGFSDCSFQHPLDIVALTQVLVFITNAIVTGTIWF